MTTVSEKPRSAKKAARRVLASRFDAVRDHLRSVADAPTDAERVHKLRVATRRATVAVAAFARYLRRRTLRDARRALRTIRRTAGAVRDWDVFFPAVRDWAAARPESVRPFADTLLGWAAAKRDSTHAGLIALVGADTAGWDALRDEVLAAVRRPTGGVTADELAREHLRIVQDELAVACDCEPATDADFHRVRIAGKRLRYTAELFADRTPDAVAIVAEMRALQDVLGRYNDGVVGANHLNEFAGHFQQFHPVEWERLRPGAEELGGCFAALRAAERARFFEWRLGWLRGTGAAPT